MSQLHTRMDGRLDEWMKVLINAGVSIRSKNNPIKLGAPFWPLANCLSESDTIIYMAELVVVSFSWLPLKYEPLGWPPKLVAIGTNLLSTLQSWNPHQKPTKFKRIWRRPYSILQQQQQQHARAMIGENRPAIRYRWIGRVWEITGWSSRRLQENYGSF